MSKKHHPGEETENGMVRGLQNRHVQLIAIDWRLHVLDDAGNRRNALYGP